MRTLSTILLLIAGAITVSLLIVVAVALSGNETAMFVAGLGIIMLGIPIFTIVLTCLIVGFTLRSKAKASQEPPESKQRTSPVFGWIAIIAAATLFVLILWQNRNTFSGFSLPEVSFFLAAFLFNLKLPFAIGAFVYGYLKIKSPAAA